MDDKKPASIDQYKEWLREKHDVDISGKTSRYYESVTDKMKRDFENSDLWNSLKSALKELDSEYFSQSNYSLLLNPQEEPELEIKPFNSFLLKTFRKNVLDNKNWPGGPDGGWLLPENWFSSVNDIVRTLLKVKYLDGVTFLEAKIVEHCSSRGFQCDPFPKANIEGYYAIHIYITNRFEIPKEDWDTRGIEAQVEIQITTQLQELIRSLLHKYYEDRRGKPIDIIENWQWDYSSEEFSANYLGHILHYVEGMIVEIREKQRGG